MVSVFCAAMLASICIMIFMPKYVSRQAASTASTLSLLPALSTLSSLDLDSAKRLLMHTASQTNDAVLNASSLLIPSGFKNLNLTTGETALFASVATLSAVFCIFSISDLFYSKFPSKNMQSGNFFTQGQQDAQADSKAQNGGTSQLSLNYLSPSIFFQGIYMAASVITLIAPGMIYFVYIIPCLLNEWYYLLFETLEGLKKHILKFVVNFSISIFIQNLGFSLVRRRGYFYNLKVRYFLLVPLNLLLYLSTDREFTKNTIEAGPFLLSSAVLYWTESTTRSANRLSSFGAVYLNLFFFLSLCLFLSIVDYFWGKSLIFGKLRELLLSFLL